MENLEIIDTLVVGDNEVRANGLISSEYVTAETFPTDANDLEKLKSLLKEFNLVHLLPTLQAANVTYRCLQYLQKQDLVEAIPHLGLRVEFREKLFVWRKESFGIDDETLSNPNKVQNRLNVSSPSSINSPIKRVFNKGQSCLEAYKQSETLRKTKQASLELIHILAGNMFVQYIGFNIILI